MVASGERAHLLSLSVLLLLSLVASVGVAAGRARSGTAGDRGPAQRAHTTRTCPPVHTKGRTKHGAASDVFAGELHAKLAGPSARIATDANQAARLEIGRADRKYEQF